MSELQSDGRPQPPNHPQLPRLTMADVLKLPESERQIVNWLRRSHGDRSGCTLAAAIAHFNQDEATLRAAFDRLLEQGFVALLDDSATPTYQLQLGSMRSQRPHSYWKQPNQPPTCERE